MVQTLSTVVVLIVAVYFLALGVISILKPAWAKTFLLGFAGSASKHYLELALRIMAGTAFIISAPRMLFGGVFNIGGWILIATTAVLCLIPWNLHRKFAEKTVPAALRFLALIGISSLVLGVFILLSVFYGPH